MMKVPFRTFDLLDDEMNFIEQALKRNPEEKSALFRDMCREYLEDHLGSPAVMLTNSTTSAFEMGMMLLELREGAEVIMPSLAPVSTASAFYRYGASIRFVDLKGESVRIDDNQLESLISDRTHVMVPVRFVGTGHSTGTIQNLARTYDINVIEDMSEMTFEKNRRLEPSGILDVIGFTGLSNFSCLEGGGLVINEKSMIEQAEILYQSGTRSDEGGSPDWCDRGSAFPLSDLVCASLYVRLSQLENMRRIRVERFSRYMDAMKSLSDSGRFSLPEGSEENRSDPSGFYLLVENEKRRNSLVTHLQSSGVQVSLPPEPLHLTSIGIKMGYSKGDLPETESVCRRLLMLPFAGDIQNHQQDYVIDRLISFFEKRKKPVSLDFLDL